MGVLRIKGSHQQVRENRSALALLIANFPNPFNPKTIINYELRIKNFVVLKVYDIAGREVATLVNETMPVGKHAVEFNAEDLPSGIYFYKLKAGDCEKTMRMVVVR